MAKYVHRTTAAPVRRGSAGAPLRPARAHSLAAHQDAERPAPNSTGVPVTPTQHAPGAAWVDLNEMQGGRQCLDEVELPDI